MQSRNDNPNISHFNFALDSVFNTVEDSVGSVSPPISNAFLLLNNSFFKLLDGTNFLLL